MTRTALRSVRPSVRGSLATWLWSCCACGRVVGWSALARNEQKAKARRNSKNDPRAGESGLACGAHKRFKNAASNPSNVSNLTTSFRAGIASQDEFLQAVAADFEGEGSPEKIFRGTRALGERRVGCGASPCSALAYGFTIAW